MDLIKCAKLSKDTLILIDLRKVFSGLVVNYASRSKKIRVFIILGAYSNNRISARANMTSSGTNFHLCLYKKTNSEKKH
jgi:hypothetical protein